MSDANRTSVVQKMFEGTPTRSQIKKQEKEKEKCKLGVCAIIKQLGGRQGALIEGTGFLVKHLFPNFQEKHHIATSEMVIPSDNLQGYFLCFKKSNSTDKAPLELASVAADPILRISGLVFIPLDTGKFSRFRRSRSGLVNHRPFTAVGKKGIQQQGCVLYCHVVEEHGTSHVVKPYQLMENENRQHYLRAFRDDSSRKHLGAPITTDVNGEAVAVGALTFKEDNFSAVFFSEFSVNVETSSGRFILVYKLFGISLFHVHHSPRHSAKLSTLKLGF